MAFPGTSVAQVACRVLPLTSEERVKGLCNQGQPSGCRWSRTGRDGMGWEFVRGVFLAAPGFAGSRVVLGLCCAWGCANARGRRWQEDMAGEHQVPEPPLALTFY